MPARELVGVDGLGAALRGAREANGWTLAQTADAAGLALWTVSKVEQGRPPTVATLFALADALGVTVDELRRPPRGG